MGVVDVGCRDFLTTHIKLFFVIENCRYLTIFINIFGQKCFEIGKCRGREIEKGFFVAIKRAGLVKIFSKFYFRVIKRLVRKRILVSEII